MFKTLKQHWFLLGIDDYQREIGMHFFVQFIYLYSTTFSLFKNIIKPNK